MSLSQSLAPLIDLVFPPRCPLCGDALAAQDGLCMSCWEGLAIPGEPSCASCGRPFADSVSQGAICAPCLADPPEHDGIAAATIYNDTSRQLILALKHGSKVSLATMLGRQMAARLDGIDGNWLVLPVPLHRWRIWQRGYNQAALLAREIARHKGARLCVDGLVRRKATPMLGGLGAKERRKALSGAIAVNPGRKELVAGASIVLVDDVMTSGATTDACVRVLKRAGAKKVRIACFARVLDEVLVAA